MAGPVCGLMLGRHGRRRHQGREAAGRRRHPPLGAARRSSGESAAFLMMNRDKRGIALDLKAPERQGGPAAPPRRGRRPDRELPAPARWSGSASATTASRPRIPGLIYCLALGLRPHRPLRRPGRLRPHRAGHERAHERHRRGAGPAADEVRAAGHRHHRRHPGGHGGARRLRAPAEDRRGAGGRHLAVRGRHHPDLLAIGDQPGDRPPAGADGLGPPAQRALPGVRDRRRLDHHRRREPGELAAPPRGRSAPRSSPSDPRFGQNRDRMANREALVGRAQPPISASAPSAEWLARLEAGGVPAGPVLDVAAMHADPQTLAREMVVEVDHTRIGPMRTLGLPVKFSQTPGPGPRAGAAPGRAQPRHPARRRLRGGRHRRPDRARRRARDPGVIGHGPTPPGPRAGLPAAQRKIPR